LCEIKDGKRKEKLKINKYDVAGAHPCNMSTNFCTPRQIANYFFLLKRIKKKKQDQRKKL
jgi:hypothetical protein